MSTWNMRLREERKRLGLSQSQFAAMAEIGYRTIGNYESGARYPGIDVLLRMQSHGVDVEYILTGLRNVTHMTTQEKDLITIYRALGEESKWKVNFFSLCILPSAKKIGDLNMSDEFYQYFFSQLEEILQQARNAKNNIAVSKVKGDK
jgi:transcriptional regulator with XRE-family HTH domain